MPEGYADVYLAAVDMAAGTVVMRDHSRGPSMPGPYVVPYEVVETTPAPPPVEWLRRYEIDAAVREANLGAPS